MERWEMDNGGKREAFETRLEMLPRVGGRGEIHLARSGV
jgi:hypothetical protein